jgi:hypothetical protein
LLTKAYRLLGSKAACGHPANGRPNIATRRFCLQKPHFGISLQAMMTRSSWRLTLALLLAVFVTAGLGLSAVQVSDMAIKMGMSSSMDMPGGDCASCPGEGPDGSGVVPCTSACLVPVLALVPQGLVADVAVSLPRLSPAHYLSLHWRQSPPDPYPPRSSDLA